MNRQETVGSGSGTSTPNRGGSTANAAARKRAEASEAYVEQDWQRVATRDDHDADAAAVDSENEEWECLVCNKSFRSEAAWNSHERSRKHIKAVSRCVVLKGRVRFITFRR